MTDLEVFAEFLKSMGVPFGCDSEADTDGEMDWIDMCGVQFRFHDGEYVGVYNRASKGFQARLPAPEAT